MLAGSKRRRCCRNMGSVMLAQQLAEGIAVFVTVDGRLGSTCYRVELYEHDDL
jgi:hypothetical protein